ncbi:MAG: Xaa-Pro peptidase family protein [Chlamydiota bacterium]|nr:Xaa-Pro peptidase family protein [Chlamydiota bacterium]
MNFKNRIKKLQASLKELKCDALIVDDVLNIFYLTGQDLSLGILFITEKAACLVVDNRYYESCKNDCSIPVTLLKGDPFEKILKFKNFQGIKSLGFDSQTTSHSKFMAHRKSAKQHGITLKALNNPVIKLRSIKDNDEISALREAAKLGSEGYDYVCSLLKPGITEIEVARELEIFWKRKGSKGLAFESIIAFGANSSMPHYKPGHIKLKRGQPVLIDIGVNLGHYHSDMTRVPFFGQPSKAMREIYDVVKIAQEAALKMCQPGVKIGDIDAEARSVMANYGYEKNFTHSLGHGVGLEIHELPFMRSNSKETLKPGMVITIEPGVYVPGEGGVRIEDTVVIHSEGYENLTCRPKDLLVIK